MKDESLLNTYANLLALPATMTRTTHLNTARIALGISKSEFSTDIGIVAGWLAAATGHNGLDVQQDVLDIARERLRLFNSQVITKRRLFTRYVDLAEAKISQTQHELRAGQKSRPDLFDDRIEIAGHMIPRLRCYVPQSKNED